MANTQYETEEGMIVIQVTVRNPDDKDVAKLHKALETVVENYLIEAP